MYAAVLFIGIQNGITVQPVVAVERTVFYRERAAGMYSALPYAFAQRLLQITLLRPLFQPVSTLYGTFSLALLFRNLEYRCGGYGTIIFARYLGHCMD
jgi:hypothetical protein